MCAQVLGMLAQSSEFSQVAIREEELPELDELQRNACPYDVKGGVENSQGKVSILLQVSLNLFAAKGNDEDSLCTFCSSQDKLVTSDKIA